MLRRRAHSGQAAVTNRPSRLGEILDDLDARVHSFRFLPTCRQLSRSAPIACRDPLARWLRPGSSRSNFSLAGLADVWPRGSAPDGLACMTMRFISATRRTGSWFGRSRRCSPRPCLRSPQRRRSAARRSRRRRRPDGGEDILRSRPRRRQTVDADDLDNGDRLEPDRPPKLRTGLFDPEQLWANPGPAHRPRNTGSRFSTKARLASR